MQNRIRVLPYHVNTIGKFIMMKSQITRTGHGVVSLWFKP